MVAEHAARQDAYASLAVRDVVPVADAAIRAGADATVVRDRLAPVVVDLSNVYGELSAVDAAEFYDEARAASSASGSYRALAAPPAPVAQVEGAVRWAVGPLFALDPDPRQALANVADVLDRLVRQPGRDTIATAVDADPMDGVRYVRRPSAGACAFCLMLGSRSYATGYRTRESAERRADGQRYHARCRCRPVPIWGPDDLPSENRRLRDAWRAGDLVAPGAS